MALFASKPMLLSRPGIEGRIEGSQRGEEQAGCIQGLRDFWVSVRERKGLAMVTHRWSKKRTCPPSASRGQRWYSLWIYQESLPAAHRATLLAVSCTAHVGTGFSCGGGKPSPTAQDPHPQRVMPDLNSLRDELLEINKGSDPSVKAVRKVRKMGYPGRPLSSLTLNPYPFIIAGIMNMSRLSSVAKG